ncbi:hypothetical protein LX36DRAFT_663064 [Colletotrichum falcatum]|nr:hypothetical protein LX36DRAFT_663064 [Colletotrichum falcatum]
MHWPSLVLPILIEAGAAFWRRGFLSASPRSPVLSLGGGPGTPTASPVFGRRTQPSAACFPCPGIFPNPISRVPPRSTECHRNAEELPRDRAVRARLGPLASDLPLSKVPPGRNLPGGGRRVPHHSR